MTKSGSSLKTEERLFNESLKRIETHDKDTEMKVKVMEARLEEFKTMTAKKREVLLSQIKKYCKHDLSDSVQNYNPLMGEWDTSRFCLHCKKKLGT